MGIVGQLDRRQMGRGLVRQIRCTELTLIPVAFAIAAPVLAAVGGGPAKSGPQRVGHLSQCGAGRVCRAKPRHAFLPPSLPAPITVLLAARRVAANHPQSTISPATACLCSPPLTRLPLTVARTQPHAPPTQQESRLSLQIARSDLACLVAEFVDVASAHFDLRCVRGCAPRSSHNRAEQFSNTCG